MFNKILIANRGEIACRIMRTCKHLGMTTVAIYADPDRDALHVRTADEAYALNGSTAAESYLCGDKIIAISKLAQVDAIHPGYGFLSENAAFAQMVLDAGLVFIGPSSAAIELMGSKQASKRAMEKAGVQTIPGYHGDKQDAATLAKEAEKIGYPVLLKARAGGGGKGMRIVHEAQDFHASLAAAQREAMASFSDDQMIIEKYLSAPRHIEVQIFADSQGHCIHLFERDCSIQRRYQKIIEESPAAGISDALREVMGKTAIAVAKAIHYQGAGTIEFLLDTDGQFYFMEMNTRLQVEHPVTEMITGLDLVELQCRVAAGEPLPVSQHDVAVNGHAIELRVYAEDPDKQFLPATGTLQYLKIPDQSTGVRVDSGVRKGDIITVHYDPLLAKLIVWDITRAQCLKRLQRALADYHIIGVKTNLGFLNSLIVSEPFIKGDIDTSFIERYRPMLIADLLPMNDAMIAIASLAICLEREHQGALQAKQSCEPGSPWHHISGWRLNMPSMQLIQLLVEDKTVTVVARNQGPSCWLLEYNQWQTRVRGERLDEHRLLYECDGKHQHATVIMHDCDLHIMVDGMSYHCKRYDNPEFSENRQEGIGGLCAPMPGIIVDYSVPVGAEVQAGDPLLVMEAMKMEHTICAPHDGRVQALLHAPGDLVDEGAPLITLESES